MPGTATGAGAGGAGWAADVMLQVASGLSGGVDRRPSNRRGREDRKDKTDRKQEYQGKKDARREGFFAKEGQGCCQHEENLLKPPPGKDCGVMRHG